MLGTKETKSHNIDQKVCFSNLHRHTMMVMQRHFDQFDWLCDSAIDFQKRPGGWPETRYEAKARRKGHEVWYFWYRKK